MTAVLHLVPLPMALSLVVAAILLAIGHFLPPRFADMIATLTALLVAALCIALAIQSTHGVLTYWFGGWTPRPNLVLGIGFGVDPASAGIAAFIALLFAAAFVFAWGYFDEVQAQFHVLMLLFLAAMVGFCFTRDLFNLFVWFEVMSVAAFALTAYQLEMPSLAGALDFTVTNSLASFMMLAGIGLIYARSGQLDFQAVSKVVAQEGNDPVVIGAFCLLAAALMIKAAVAPFHFWLSDAHAVAPSPVSVIFSGAMVTLGLFGLTKIGLQIFATSAPVRFLIHDLFLALAALTAIVGALMAWSQRHLKRVLAFSTIAHIGIMLVGFAALSETGLAGLLVYFVGHGLVKGALFMLAGVLLATRASADELDLYNCGKGLLPAGIAMIIAGLLLGGAPCGLLDDGAKLIDNADTSAIGPWIAAAILLGTALTGAAVLRAAGRIFFGLGPQPDPDEVRSPSEEEQEKANRPLWLMMLPCVLLLLLALLPGSLGEHLGTLAARLAPSSVPLAAPTGSRSSAILPWISMLLAIAIAALDLFREHVPEMIVKPTTALAGAAFAGLRVVHSGLVGDYVLWIFVGLACFSATLLLS